MPLCWNTMEFPPVVFNVKEFRPPNVVIESSALLSAMVGPALLCKESMDIGDVVPMPAAILYLS